MERSPFIAAAALVTLACGTATQIPDEKIPAEGETAADGEEKKPYSMACPSGQSSDLRDGAEVL